MSAELAEAIKAQQASIERLTEAVALLVGVVGELLGEEIGASDDAAKDDPTSTMDGDGLKFRGARG